MEAIIDSWVVGNGFGPGHPTRFFYSDNGGEFCNSELINCAAEMDTTIKYTAANSPWQNGTVERHHYTADVVFSKVMSDNPNMDPQKAVDKAAFCKNSEINQTGFSSLQLIMGKSPTFPGLAEAKPRSNDLDSSNKALRALKDIDDVRVKFRGADCSKKLRKIQSERINHSVEQFYQM